MRTGCRRHILAAEHEDGMLVERGAHVGMRQGNVGDGDAAQFGAEAWTQPNDLHRRLPDGAFAGE